MRLETFQLLLLLVYYGEGRERYVSRGDQGPDDENSQSASIRVSPGTDQELLN